MTNSQTDQPRNNGGPLHGMRVIELAHVMAGPVCGLMLADMGADVIKVENINGGDDTRRMVPPEINGESAAFMMMNRNKRGIALDLKNPAGKDVFLTMIKDADVLIENYRHDTMTKLGIGYDTLKEINPGLIYCEISGFGRTGPYKDRGGFDLIAQGMSGIMSVTGEGPDREPVKVGPPVSDITAGILAAMGVNAAYIHKLKTGQGQRVDTSLFEAAITHTYWQSAICFATGVSPQPMGSAHPLNAPYQSIATSDGWINLGAANPNNWLRMLKAIDAEHLASDNRFTDNAARMANREILVKVLGEYFQKKTTDEWMHTLNDLGIPAGPVLSIAEMHNDPQAIARDMVTSVDHPAAGTVKTIGSPVKFHSTPTDITRPAPLFGQHAEELLVEFGYSSEQIEKLLEKGVVASHAGDSGEL